MKLNDKRTLRILELLSKLMKVPKKANEDCCNTYIDCMAEAVNYEITKREESLKSSSEACYVKLTFIVDRNT